MTFNYPEKVILNGTTFYVDSIFNNSEHDKSDISLFLRTIYNQFVAIRRILGGQKCQKMHLVEVKERLEDIETREKVMKILKLDEESLQLVLYVAEKHIKMVK